LPQTRNQFLSNLASTEYVTGSRLQSGLFSEMHFKDSENDVMEASKSVTDAFKTVTEASNFVKALKDELRKWLNSSYATERDQIDEYEDDCWKNIFQHTPPPPVFRLPLNPLLRLDWQRCVIYYYLRTVVMGLIKN